MDVHTIRGPLPAADRAAVRALVDRAAAADGVAPLDEAALLALADDIPTLHLLASETSTAGAVDPSDARAGLVGYAQVDLGTAPAGTQLVVDPGPRERGIGRALLAAAVAAAPGGALEVWAHGDLPAARALAASANLDKVHELWRMALDLRRRPPAPAPAWPPGLVVRPFAPARDETAWLAVNARAFADHPDQGRWTAHDLAAREREDWFDPDGFLLAERAGALAGFVWTKVHPAGDLAPEPVGEIYVLGVDPSAQGGGLGRALTSAGLDHLVGRGLGTAVLWVAGDNAAAIHTYRRAGFERAALDVRYAHRAVDIPGSPDGATMGS